MTPQQQRAKIEDRKDREARHMAAVKRSHGVFTTLKRTASLRAKKRPPTLAEKA
jgi:hypothetical protein